MVVLRHCLALVTCPTDSQTAVLSRPAPLSCSSPPNNCRSPQPCSILLRNSFSQLLCATVLLQSVVPRSCITVLFQSSVPLPCASYLFLRLALVQWSCVLLHGAGHTTCPSVLIHCTRVLQVCQCSNAGSHELFSRPFNAPAFF